METWFYPFSELSRTYYHHFLQILFKKVDGDCNLWSVAKDRGHHRSKVQNIFSAFFLTLFLIQTWGSNGCDCTSLVIYLTISWLEDHLGVFFLAPSWMCGSSSTASLVLCSQELRNVIGSYLAQSSGGDVKECSLLKTKKGSCRQSLSTGRAQSRGGRLLLRWGGDVLNRDGQGLACWTIGLKLSKCWSFNDFKDPPPGFWFSQRAPQPTALPSSASSEFLSVCTSI